MHSTITDLATSSPGVMLAPATTGSNNGIFQISPKQQQQSAWTAVFFSKARGPPSAEELAAVTTPLPAGPTNVWGSRAPPPPPPPPPPAPGPLPKCPPTGCAGCSGCHWPYLNATEPSPSRPFVASQENATVLECETKCSQFATAAGDDDDGNTGGCVGFTYRSSACWHRGLLASEPGQAEHPVALSQSTGIELSEGMNVQLRTTFGRRITFLGAPSPSKTGSSSTVSSCMCKMNENITPNLFHTRTALISSTHACSVIHVNLTLNLRFSSQQ